MGKTLIIRGANFSAVAVDCLADKVIDFSTATVKPYNIAEALGVVRLTAPTNGNPSFYEIDCNGYTEIIITCTTARLLIANAKLPDTTTGQYGDNIESYFANVYADSYYGTYNGNNSTISLPPNSKYLYIRKTITNGTDTTPSSATLKVM